jgi:LacI family transcriptional regulator
MKPSRRLRIVLLGDLQVHAIREVCQGAAEYVAEKSTLDFDPWPVPTGDPLPSPFDLSCVDGLLVSAPVAQLVDKICKQRRIPRIYFLTTGEFAKVPRVELNEEAIGQMAAEHLLVRGYRHLAFVGSSTMGWSSARCKGFMRVAKAAGVPVQKYEFTMKELPTYWSPQLTIRQTILNKTLSDIPKPCGILAGNDVIACFLVETARYYGMGVPQQVGVVGVDDDPIPNSAAGLAISSVQVPFREVGRQAARLLDEMRRGHKAPPRLVLPPARVVVRASTNAFMVEDFLVRKAQAYIETHRKRRVAVAEVVKVVTTTAVTLNKHFARHLNTTPSEYILRRRIDYAKELLRTGELNVDEVSRACSFHSCSYFCRVFRQMTGTNPGSLRPRRPCPT